MDIICIEGLRVDTIIGVYSWERKIKQTVIIDLKLACDSKKAAANDDIADALDYKAVAKRMISFVQESQFQLVETLAERSAEMLIQEFNVPWLKLSVNKKGAVSKVRNVGVVIERGNA